MNLNNSQGNNSSSNNDNNLEIPISQISMDQDELKEFDHNNILNNNDDNDNNNILNNNDDNNYDTAKEKENEKEKEKEKEEKSINNNNLNYEENEDNKIDKINYNSVNNINNANNINNVNNSNNITISNLLFQLKQMSDRQLYLLDIISNLQKNSSEQINNLNKRIKYLEEKIVKHSEYGGYGGNINLDDKEIRHNRGGEDLNNILTRLLNDNKNEKLIKFLNELNLEQIKKLDIKLIEDTLIKLCILITQGFKVHEIICFIKGILIINKIKLKEITKKNLKDVFNYVQKNLTNLKDEDSIDISLIISYLNI